MSEEVTIEVDGRSIPAIKGEMLIAATDRAGIYIPRFCYHKNLSVAANCRMCLVEVERAPKPLPACATPVSGGMKVFTESPTAVDAQRGTMEFLLINHPLDCPICDQGGECELQDLAMGYGSDVSRYTERKRVVKDKDVGPLIKTDMTRCIHCTRCVRFGEEIAGLRELGATGRGEHMEIGTYIAKSINSEVSGNVIDLCPVGALTNRPYRYTARAWELRQVTTVSPHDCVGSNIQVHFKGPVVKRVVPADNPSINETWIADRDRYSVHAMASDDRLTAPRIKVNGEWREAGWQEALERAAAGIRSAVAASGGDGLAAVLSPNATCEEGLLAQRLLRGLGSGNVDHRLRQADFSADDLEPLMPGLRLAGGDLAEIERDRAILLVGAYTRHEQPVLNIRLRKAALAGCRVMSLGSLTLPFNFDLATEIEAAPAALVERLAALVAAAEGGAADADIEPVVAALEDSPARIILGECAYSHSAYGEILRLSGRLAAATGATLSQVPPGGNSAGLWLTGAVPHRAPGGGAPEARGRPAHEILAGAAQPQALLLVDCEPERDALAGDAALAALGAASDVVVLTAFESAAIADYATVQLPIATFSENDGTLVNCAGLGQGLIAGVKPPGEARPAWKVLRVLGELLGVEGFGFSTLDDVIAEVTALIENASATAAVAQSEPGPSADSPAGDGGGLRLVTMWPMYGTDPVVRRSPPLAATMHCGDDRVHLNPQTAEALRLSDGQRIIVEAGDGACEAELSVGRYVARDAVFVYGGRRPARALGAALAAGLPVSVRAARAEASA